MSEFDVRWLDLREGADHAARDKALRVAAARSVPPGGLVVDLGCGTGSTLRALQPRLAEGVRWRLVDNDARLLAVARNRHPEAETAVADLAAATAPIEDADLVTASALLDLVSAEWLGALSQRLNGGLYAALNYDGAVSWTEPHRLDAEVMTAFNRHQEGDKGFGPALGRRAVRTAMDLLGARGFKVRTARSAWRLGAAELLLERELIGGIAQAAVEAGCDAARDWGAIRKALAGRGCVVGHLDLLALPG
jgi:SAM-dependent methyltransferase